MLAASQRQMKTTETAYHLSKRKAKTITTHHFNELWQIEADITLTNILSASQDITGLPAVNTHHDES